MSFVFPNAGGYYELENAANVYADVAARGELWQDPRRAAVLHNVLGTVLKPDVYLINNSDQILADSLEQHYGIAINSNHTNALDPVHLAPMADSHPAFEGMRGHTMIGAKVGVHKTPIIGSLVPDLGSTCLWRKPKDVFGKGYVVGDKPNSTLSEKLRGLVDRKTYVSEAEEAEVKLMIKQANADWIRLMRLGMHMGLHLVNFGPGTRENESDQSKKTVSTVKNGFGRIISRVVTPVRYGAAAIYYGDKEHHSLLKPTIVVDLSCEQDRSSAQKVTEIIKPTMQEVLNYAVHVHDKTPLRPA